MMQKTMHTQRSIAAIGEEIEHELGDQMIKDYQRANPTDVSSYIIGRNIIDQLLAQPGCVGIQFYNAYNERGEKTLVYIGMDTKGNALLEYSTINNEGVLETKKGIVADRSHVPGSSKPKKPGGGISDADDWNWDVD